ncbi:hypothetical protein [Mycobacterium colombiense]|uniref:hypothetical protein n=1 Tax=Mycobacterium colombiense TaxID=339268 RepID=UPI00094A0A88|nr:hypothetical protein [Mycobacterium colombiense]
MKTELKWVEPYDGHFHANIDDRSEYRVHAVSTGGFRAERVDDGQVGPDEPHCSSFGAACLKGAYRRFWRQSVRARNYLQEGPLRCDTTANG